MAIINEWRGDAEKIAHSARVQINSAINGTLYELVLARVATVSTRGTATDTRATIASRLAGLAAAAADVSVETSENSFTITGREPGVPIAEHISGNNPAGSFVKRVRPGVLPTEQEFLIALPATTTGGTWKIIANFGGDDETTANIAHNASPDAVTTALGNLTTPAASDFVTTLEQTSPRTYRVRVTGNYAGVPITLKVDAKLLAGNASVSITKSQTIAGATANEIQAVWIDGISSVDTNWHVLRFSADNGVTWSAWTTQPFNNASSALGLTQIQAALDAVYGSGVVTASLFLSANENTGGPTEATLLLKFAGTETHNLVNVEIRNEFPGPEGNVSWQRLQTGGGISANDFQVVNVADQAGTTNTFKFTWDGNESTNSVAVGSNSATIVTALESITGIGSGDVAVHRGAGQTKGLYVIETKGALANANQPPFSITSIIGGGIWGGVTQYQDGSPGQNEIQKIIINADGGTLQYSHDGNGPTVATDHDEATATVQSRLEGLASIGAGGVSLTGSGTPADPFLAEFIGDNAGRSMALITATTASLLGGKLATVTEDKPAVAGVNEQQMVHIDPNASGGTYRLGFQGQLADAVAHNSTVANMLTKFLAVSTVGADNATADGTASQILIEFQNDLKWQPLELITIDQDALIVTGTAAMTVETITQATGPNHWNNPANWTLQHVPRTSETPVLGSGRSDILFGIIQASECTFDGTDIVCAKNADFVDGQTIRLRTTDTLPTAQNSGGAVVLSTSTSYFIVAVDYRDGVQVLKISTTDNGEPIEFTDAGTGTHRVSVQLAALHQYATYTGKVGQPRRASNGKWIDAQRYLEIDFLDPSGGEPNLEIGIGKGSGTALFNLDAGPAYLDARIIKTAAPNGGAAAFNLLNDNLAESELLLIAGSSAIATESDQAAKLKKILSFENARLQLGNVDFTRLENYGEQVEFTSGTASGSVVQMRNR